MASPVIYPRPPTLPAQKKTDGHAWDIQVVFVRVPAARLMTIARTLSSGDSASCVPYYMLPVGLASTVSVCGLMCMVRYRCNKYANSIKHVS